MKVEGAKEIFTVSIRDTKVDVILFTDITMGFHASAHTHSGYEFHYIHGGGAEIRIGLEQSPMVSGCCYLVPKGCFHHVQMATGEITRLSLLINPQQEGLIRLGGLSSFVPEAQLGQLLELLIEALSPKWSLPDRKAYLQAGITMLLLHLTDRFSAKPQERALQEPEQEVLSEEAAKQAVLSYLAGDLALASLPGLAEKLHMSPRQAARFLREKMGKNFSELLRSHRIEYARTLLIAGVESLEEIAFLCGYDSYKGFHTAFCKYMGVNPKAYKQSLFGKD